MKYSLESLSTPVRLDHDKNILSYEHLNVAAEGLSPDVHWTWALLLLIA